MIWLTRVLVSAVGILLLWGAAHAAVPPHLDEMPEIDRVLAIQGRDRLDRAARQVAALEHLIHMVTVLSDGRQSRDQLTADERRIVQTYAVAVTRVEEPTLASFGIEGSHRQKMEQTWASLRAGYAADAAFRQGLLEQFFSPEWQGRYREVDAPRGLELVTAPEPSFVMSVLVPIGALGVAGVILVFVVRAVIRRRRAARAERDAPFLDVLEASAREALRDLRRATAGPVEKRSRR